MLPHLARLLPLSTLVVWLLLGSSSALVVCVESDGRVQLELPSIECCDSESVPRGAEHGGEESHGGEGCSDCDDLSFIAVRSTQRVVEDAAQSVAWSCPPLLMVDALPRVSRSRAWIGRASPDEPPRHLAPLRCSVLRC